MPGFWKHSRRLTKAASAWFPQPTLGIYTPVPATGNNKLFRIVTDATGQTTGRSLQAIYQIKRVLSSTLKVWVRKQLSLNRKLLPNWKASSQALKKSLEVKVGAGHPAGSRGHLLPCPCPLVIQAEWDYSAPHRRSSHSLRPVAQDCDCNGPRISGGSGLSLRPPVSWERGAFDTWMHGISWSQGKISTEWHPASPFALQHFTEEEPREEDGCFNASVSLGVSWPKAGRKGAFAPFVPFGTSTALHAAGTARSRCCPLGAAGAAEPR